MSNTVPVIELSTSDFARLGYRPADVEPWLQAIVSEVWDSDYLWETFWNVVETVMDYHFKDDIRKGYGVLCETCDGMSVDCPTCDGTGYQVLFDDEEERSSD
jgi:CDGSH-type Zn-finger protein